MKFATMLINFLTFFESILRNLLPLFKLILNKVHVILADSNDLVRVGMRTILNAHGGFKIVGEAKDKTELKDLVKNFGAAVVLIDYTSPGFDIDIIPKDRKSTRLN